MLKEILDQVIREFGLEPKQASTLRHLVHSSTTIAPEQSGPERNNQKPFEGQVSSEVSRRPPTESAETLFPDDLATGLEGVHSERVDVDGESVNDELDPSSTFTGFDDEELAELLGPVSVETQGPTILPNTSQPGHSTSPLPATPQAKDGPPRLGRYLDLGLLGIGGMGEVRRVRDDILRRTLAMKIIHQKLLNHRGAVTRFIEEAQIGAQLEHPNIIPVYELGKLENGRHYFTMKVIRGTEFSKHIQAVHQASEPERWRAARGGISFRNLIQTFHKLCVTIAYAHSKGVIHRDLKPENIMIGGFGEVLIVDWGLAKVLGREQAQDWEYAVETDRSHDNIMATRLGSIAGTPCYMSPEQAHGLTSEIGFPSDIYTLGAILYEILSGEPPFVGETANEVIERVRSESPRSLRDSGPPGITDESGDSVAPAASGTRKLPEALVALCERAMSREMSDRFGSAEELANAVLGWLEGAEKRDKGLNEVAAADASLQQARSIEEEAAHKWAEANQRLEREGMESEAAWALWEEAKSAQKEAQALRRRHQQQLLGALVHAPELETAHAALAELWLAEVVRASALGDRQDTEVGRQQFQVHLQHLAPSVQGQLQASLAAQLNDTIAGQRSRRGEMVGRHAQRETIAGHMRDGGKMVSLVGTAGVGKTRLALELAEDLREQFQRAVFCDLTEATDTLGVARLISRAMNVRLRDANPVEHLSKLLAETPTLLIMDNLEQVIKAVGEICQRWSEEVSSLGVIATSRAKLNIPSETVFTVAPLSLLESMELFAQRGQGADGRFELTPDNRALVSTLVGKLDGLPLAIELAAARLNIMSLEEVADRLDERFSLLRSRGRDGQALQGALDWSWDLLEPWAKAALSQVSLFRGGFSLAAAEAVVSPGEFPERPAMFDILGELADNSLLRRDQSEDDNIRYGLLESIRAYAAKQLQTEDSVEQGLSGDAAQREAQLRHARHFAQYGRTQYLRGLDSFDSGRRWTELFQELDNLVAAIDYGDAQTAPRCCLAALKVLTMKGPVSLGVDIADKVLNMKELPKRLRMQLELERSKCLRISGRMNEARAAVIEQQLLDEDAVTEEVPKRPNSEPIETLSLPDEPTEEFFQGEPDDQNSFIMEAERLLELGRREHEQSQTESALIHLREALAAFRERGHQRGEAEALGLLGAVMQSAGQFQRALEISQQSAALAQAIRVPRIELFAIATAGVCCRRLGDDDQALEHYERALDIATKIGDKRRESNLLSNIGNIFRQHNELRRAQDHFDASLRISREIQDQRCEGITLGNLGLVHVARNEFDQAIDYYQDSLAIARAIGDKLSEGIQLGNLGSAYHELKQMKPAEECLRQAIDICEALLPPAAAVYRSELAVILASQDRIREALEHTASAEPIIQPIKDEYALFLCRKGQVLLRCGDPTGAASALEQARALQAELGLGPASELGREIRRLSELAEPPYAEADGPSIEGEETEQAVLHAEQLMERGDLENAEARYNLAKMHYESALEAFRQAKHRPGEAKALGQIALIQQIGGHPQAAIELLNTALEIDRTLGDKNAEGLRLASLAGCHMALGQADLAIETYQRALAAAKAMGNRRREGAILGNLGVALLSQGDAEEALRYQNEALKIAREVGDSRSEGIWLGALGSAYQLREQWAVAATHFEQALHIARKIGDRRFECIHLGNLGENLVKQARWLEAEPWLLEAIPIADEVYPAVAGAFRGFLARCVAQRGALDQALSLLEIGKGQVTSRPEEYARFLCNQGFVQLSAGRIQPASQSLTEAQALAQQLNLRPDSEAGKTLQSLKEALALQQADHDEPTLNEETMRRLHGDRLLQTATLELEQSNYQGAQLAFGKALRHFRSLQYDEGEAEALSGLAMVSQHRGENQRALELHTEALAVIQRTNNKQSLSSYLGKLGLAHQRLGNNKKSIEINEEALGLAESINDLQSQVTYLGYLGLAHKNLGKPEPAIAYFQRSLQLAEAVGDNRAVGVQNGNLALTYQHQGQLTLAVSHNRRALKAIREHGDRRSESRILGNLGLLHQLRGELNEAMDHYNQAVTIGRQIGDKGTEGIHLGNLGGVHKLLGNIDLAVSFTQQAVESARATNDNRFVGINLGNLGDLRILQGRYDEAVSVLKEAVQICDNTVRVAGGAFRGSLALALLHLGHSDEAQATMSAALKLVQSEPYEHIKLLCKKTELESRLGQTEQAKATFAEAERIASTIEVRGNNDLAIALAKAEAALRAPSTGPREDSTSAGNGHDESLRPQIAEAKGLIETGQHLVERQSFDQAMAAFVRAGTLFKALNDATGEGFALVHMADCMLRQGHLAAANHLKLQAEALWKASPETSGRGALTRALQQLSNRLASEKAREVK